MKKALYFEKEAAEGAIKARQKYVDEINKLSEALEKEGITLTNKILAAFLSRGVECIEELLVESTVRQYEKAGILVNSVMLSTLQQNASAVAFGFNPYYEPIRQAQHGAGISPDLVFINDQGRALFTDAERKEIEENFTVRLRKEDEELYKKLTELVQILNSADKELEKAGEGSLLTTLKVILIENSKIMDYNQQLRLRSDVYLVLNQDGQIEVNPAYFKH
jgi:N-dimethylarginine dimethylaminohydrolase